MRRLFRRPNGMVGDGHDVDQILWFVFCRNAHIFDDPPMPDQLAPIYTRIKGLAEAMDDREATHDYQAFMNLERDLISERIHARTRDIATPYARAQLAAEDEVIMGPLDEVVAKGVKVNSQLDDQASMIASLCEDQKVIVGRHEQVNKHFTTIEPRLVQVRKALLCLFMLFELTISYL